MAAMNVYVPDALKAQMDELEGQNWSAIAQEAFRLAMAGNAMHGRARAGVVGSGKVRQARKGPEWFGKERRGLAR